MPELRHARHRDLEYISDVYSIFGLCLGDGNCQAKSYQAPFDATTKVTAKDIDMETVAQSGIRYGGNSLYDRGHRVKSFQICSQKAAHRCRQRPSNDSERRSSKLTFCSLNEADPLGASCQCLLGYFRLIGPSIDWHYYQNYSHFYENYQTHWDGTSIGLHLEFNPTLPRLNGPL